MDQYDEFALRIYSAAVPVCQKYNLPPQVVTSQGCIESGWGKYTIGEFNLFGRKWGGWGNYQEVPTQEEVNGEMINIIDKFQLYDSLEQAIDDWCQLMLWDEGDYKQYAVQYQSDGDIESFIRGIASVYATDSAYADKIISTMNSLSADGVFA